MQTGNRPCPRCGGNDRFYLVRTPRNGGSPHWRCRQCDYTEGADSTTTDTEQKQAALSNNDIAIVQQVYSAVAGWCADYIWTPTGRAVLDYLHKRGLTDETIRTFRLGFSPIAETKDSLAVVQLWSKNKTLYTAANKFSGLTSDQARAAPVLRNTVTFPYWSDTTCTMLRGRTFKTGDGPRYFSPSGQMYAGGTPTLYLANLLAETGTVILTEGEFKALAVALSRTAVNVHQTTD